MGAQSDSELDFGALLDELIVAAKDKESAQDLRGPSLHFDLLAQIERLQSQNPAIQPTRAFGEYQAHASEADAKPWSNPGSNPGEEASLEPALEDLFYLDPNSIARELGLAERKTPADLDRARRAFALRYHPDRVSEEMRDRAKVRMQIANMLIDEAKRGRR